MSFLVLCDLFSPLFFGTARHHLLSYENNWNTALGLFFPSPSRRKVMKHYNEDGVSGDAGRTSKLMSEEKMGELKQSGVSPDRSCISTSDPETLRRRRCRAGGARGEKRREGEEEEVRGASSCRGLRLFSTLLRLKGVRPRFRTQDMPGLVQREAVTDACCDAKRNLLLLKLRKLRVRGTLQVPFHSNSL